MGGGINFTMKFAQILLIKENILNKPSFKNQNIDTYKKATTTTTKNRFKKITIATLWIHLNNILINNLSPKICA